jgi:hypothetical protein
MPLINAPPTYTNGHHAAANGHAVKDKPFPGPSETRPSLCVRPSQSRASTLTDERVHRLPKLVLKPWVSPAPAGLVLTNAQVIDPNAGKLLEGLQSVVIRDGKIAAVYPIDEPDLLAEEGSLRRVDVGGRYISPGLIDGHVHVTAVPGMHNLKEMCEAPPETISYRTTYVLREMLMRGFTTVRDTGKSAFFSFFFAPSKRSRSSCVYTLQAELPNRSRTPSRKVSSPALGSSSAAKPFRRPADTATLCRARAAANRDAVVAIRSSSAGLQTASRRCSRRRGKSLKPEQSEFVCARSRLAEYA